MTNKELYDKAIADGLDFTYFHGEDESPFDKSPSEDYWEMEQGVAAGDTSEVVEDFEDLKDEDIPEFIKISNAPVAKKATAFAAMKVFGSWCPAPIKVKDQSKGQFSDYFIS